MGTKIGPLIVKSRNEISLTDLSGKIIGVDAFITIYAFLARIRSRETGGGYFTDQEGNVTSHLIGLFNRMTSLLAHNISPVFIFDGEPPQFKAKEIKSRQEKKEQAEENRQEALARGDLESAMKYAQATSRVTSDIIEDAKRLLKYLGIPSVQAASEAEAQGVIMIQQNKIYAMATQDYDSFLFGGPRILRNLSVTQRRKQPSQDRWSESPPEQVLLKDILQELGLNSRDQLIMLGLLIGTDYNPDGIKGIGPKTGLKLVQQYNTLPSLLNHLKLKFDLKEVFPYPPSTLFEYFRSPEVDLTTQIMFPKFDKSKVIEFLVEERDFNQDRVERQLNTMVRKRQRLKLESARQSLDQFF
ncbi:MAG: flap endonuclease-1 [Candidatus Thorarchaeota archaeon]